MKNSLCFFLISTISLAQNSKIAIENKAMIEENKKYIFYYYKDFKTEGFYKNQKTLWTNNYKVSFDKSVFKMTFFDHLLKIEKEVKINLKKVISIEPTANFENDFSNNSCLLFKTSDSKTQINTEYEVDADVSKTKIFKAFERLIEYYNKK